MACAGHLKIACLEWIIQVIQTTHGKEVRRTNYRFMESIKKQSIKRIVNQMSPEEITPEFLEELKGDKENLTSMEMFKQCLQSYATHTKPENVNESFLNYLYENGFRGEIPNPLINLTYKTFCDGKVKDQQIHGLETKIEKQDELINYDEKVIGQLTSKINKLHEITSKAKAALQNISGKVHEIGAKTHKLGKDLENEEPKSIFKIITQRIKRAFSKMPLLPASNECEDIYKNSQTIGSDANNCRFSMQTYDEKQNTQEINEILRQRQSIKRKVDTPEPTRNADKDKSGVIEFYFEKEDGWEIGEQKGFFIKIT